MPHAPHTHQKASLRVFLLLLLFAVLVPAHAEVFDRLYKDSEQLVLAQPLQWMSVPKGVVASPDELARVGNFQPYRPDTILPTSDRQDAWLTFALPATETAQTWFVRIPRTTIARISLFARDGQGRWQSQSAGDTIAPAQWALRTRVPSFELHTRSDAENVYYLHLEHRVPITERPILLTPIEYVDGASRVGLVIGLMWGVFGFLVVLAVAAFAVTHNKVFVWFGLFAVALMFAQLVLIGYGGWRMWPHSKYLNQAMPWVSGALALAAAAWFFAHASYAHDSHPRIYRLLVGAACVSLGLACMMAADKDFVPRNFRNFWLTAATILIVLSMLWLCLRGQSGNLLFLAGTAPIALAALARLSYNFGWFVHVEAAQIAGVFSATLGLIWIFLILAWRNREALLFHDRPALLATYDSATGLMLPHVVGIRLPQMLLRAGRFKPGCGVLMLRWLEHAQHQGVMNNEKRAIALARLGTILRDASRDIDTVVRYSNDEFVMLVEGPVSRKTLSEASTQILAACIRSSRKTGNVSAFNLHIAIWHGDPGLHLADAAMELLKTRLQQMSSGTRRPVQFVDASGDAPDIEDDDTTLRRKELLEKINALEIAHPPALAKARGMAAANNNNNSGDAAS